MAVESDFPFEHLHYGQVTINTSYEYIHIDGYGFGWGAGTWAGNYITINSSGSWTTLETYGVTGLPVQGILGLYEPIAVNVGDEVWIHSDPMWAGTSSVGISNITQLQFIKNYKTDNHHLLNNIDASDTLTWNAGAGFVPIGNSTIPFTGSFDGAGYNITGLHIYLPIFSVDAVGLFGNTNNSILTNVNIIDANVTGYTYTSMLCGLGYNTTISNIHATGNVSGNADVAPIAGLLRYGSLVSRCTADTNVTGSSTSFSLSSGLVAYIRDATTIDQCSSNGTVTGSGDRNGGLVATASESSIISNSYSHSTVSGDYTNAALVGLLSSSTVTNCYATGYVTGTSTEGLIDVNTGGTVTNSYWDVNTTGQTTSSGGTGKTTLEMLQRSTYSGWDFTSLWDMQLYPVLQFEDVDYSLNPVIIYPVNATTIDSSYPALTDVTFRWAEHRSVDATYYQLARDSNYNTLVTSGSSTVTSKIISLDADEYYFKVRYLFDTGEYSEWVESQFSINTTVADYGTGIQGVVFRLADGSKTALSGVKVTAYNDNVSYDYTTGSNGFYLFDDGLIDAGTWYLVASKDGYETSNVNIVQVITNNTTTKDIFLEEDNAPNYILPHYVLFTVKSVFGGVYPDVTVNVYEGDSATSIYTGTTGDDGAVGFELSETIRYRLTLYSEEHDIDTTYRVTPTKDSYNIYISLYSTEPTQQDDGIILYGVHTDGNDLNVTWNDTSGLTTNVYLWINNTDGSNAYYLTSTDSDSSLTQEVNTTANLTYVVKLKIESAGLENDFIKTHVVNFEEGVKTAFNLGFTDTWQSMFLAALSIIFIAVLFGSANAHVGAVMVSLAGLFHVFVTGWIPANPLTVVMLFIAVIVAGLFYMRKGEAVR